MARTPATLPGGTRITDHISVGVLTNAIPRSAINRVLAETNSASQRERQLPAHVVVYFVVAMTLLMNVSYREVLRWLLEGLNFLKLQGHDMEVNVTGKSGISQARSRLGAAPMRQLCDELVQPIAVRNDEHTTIGAWYKDWRLVSMDGSSFDLADTAANAEAFGYHKASRGESAFPKLRIVSLVENGTHVLFGSKIGSWGTSEAKLADRVVEHLEPGMLCMADRGFYSFSLWTKAKATGAELVWRMKSNRILPIHRRLPDGSCLSKVYPSTSDRKHDRNGVVVRLIEYRLDDSDDDTVYRLITTILDPDLAPAEDLAALYHERWEIETAFDELKTHLRGSRITLRSKTPELVRQELYGFLLSFFAIRSLMHEAALQANEDADRLSFTHAVNVVRRKLILAGAFPP